VLADHLVEHGLPRPPGAILPRRECLGWAPWRRVGSGLWLRLHLAVGERVLCQAGCAEISGRQPRGRLPSSGGPVRHWSAGRTPHPR
jgi:hypothetical protein